MQFLFKNPIPNSISKSIVSYFFYSVTYCHVITQLLRNWNYTSIYRRVSLNYIFSSYGWDLFIKRWSGCLIFINCLRQKKDFPTLGKFVNCQFFLLSVLYSFIWELRAILVNCTVQFFLYCFLKVSSWNNGICWSLPIVTKAIK